MVLLKHLSSGKKSGPVRRAMVIYRSPRQSRETWEDEWNAQARKRFPEILQHPAVPASVLSLMVSSLRRPSTNKPNYHRTRSIPLIHWPVLPSLQGKPMSKLNPYVLLLTLIATLGGLLFGYDTAVINGAVDSLKAYFIDPRFNLADPAQVNAANSLLGQVV